MRAALIHWVRFCFDVACAGLAMGLGLLTLASRDWIEVVFGVDPDRGSGVAEWAIVLILGVAAVVAGGLARREWSRMARTA